MIFCFKSAGSFPHPAERSGKGALELTSLLVPVEVEINPRSLLVFQIEKAPGFLCQLLRPDSIVKPASIWTLYVSCSVAAFPTQPSLALAVASELSPTGPSPCLGWTAIPPSLPFWLLSALHRPVQILLLPGKNFLFCLRVTSTLDHPHLLQFPLAPVFLFCRGDKLEEFLRVDAERPVFLRCGTNFSRLVAFAVTRCWPGAASGRTGSGSCAWSTPRDSHV